MNTHREKGNQAREKALGATSPPLRVQTASITHISPRERSSQWSQQAPGMLLLAGALFLLVLKPLHPQNPPKTLTSFRPITKQTPGGHFQSHL